MSQAATSHNHQSQSDQLPESARPFEADHKFLGKTLAALAKAELQVNAVVQLEHLQKYLPAHFGAEEGPRGFFEYVLSKAPHHQAEVTRLQEEHPRLLELLHLARTAAQATMTLGPKTRSAIDDLIDALKQHERAEDDLLQEALDRDLSGH